MSQNLHVPLGRLSDLVTAVEQERIEIRESLDMHQFCSYWGAYDVFSYLKDCICLVHGTVGCMSNRRFLPVMGSSEPCEFQPQYSTAFNENDVIFGGEKKLEKAVKAIYQKHDPSLIAVITNCCADIIGDDVAGVLKSVGEITDKVVWLHTGGFSGKSYRKGSEEAFRVLAELMENSQCHEVEQGTVNIFQRRWIWGETQENEMAESTRLMTKLGIKVNCKVKKGMTLDEFISLRKAEANVASCFYFGMSLFQEMEQRFGTKSIKASTPVGLEATLEWLSDVKNTMNLTYDIENDSEVIELKEMREQVRNKIGKGRKAIIWCQTGERMIGLTKFAQDVGLDPICVGVDLANIRDKIKMFRKEVNAGFDPLVTTLTYVEDIRNLASAIGDPVIMCGDDFFPEYHFFKYKLAQNQVYGLKGTKLMYKQLLKALSTKRSPYSLVAEVVR